jgi:hypothetical protein
MNHLHSAYGLVVELFIGHELILDNINDELVGPILCKCDP